MAKTKCQKCGKRLPKGFLKYRVKIMVYSDFDGVIITPTDSNYKEELKKIMEKVKSLPANLLEEEIHREFEFIICRECKERFCANPLNLPLKNVIIPDSMPDTE